MCMELNMNRVCRWFMTWCGWLSRERALSLLLLIFYLFSASSLAAFVFLLHFFLFTCDVLLLRLMRTLLPLFSCAHYYSRVIFISIYSIVIVILQKEAESVCVWCACLHACMHLVCDCERCVCVFICLVENNVLCFGHHKNQLRNHKWQLAD